MNEAIQLLNTIWVSSAIFLCGILLKLQKTDEKAKKEYKRLTDDNYFYDARILLWCAVIIFAPFILILAVFSRIKKLLK